MTTTEIVQSVLAGGIATTYATQILKNRYVPIPVTSHPRITAAAVSLVASVIAVTQAGVDLTNLGDWVGAVSVFAGILLVASNAYHQIVKE